MLTQKAVSRTASIRVHRYPPSPNSAKPFPTRDSRKAVCTPSNLELPKEPNPITGRSPKAPQSPTYDRVRLASSFACHKSPASQPRHFELPNDPSPITAHFALRSLKPDALRRKTHLCVSASKTPLPARNRTSPLPASPLRTGHQPAFERVTLS